MKRKILYFVISSVLLLNTTGCNDFLDKDMYQFTNDNFWQTEDNLRAYCYEFYPYYMEGYTQDFEKFGGYFSGDTYNDDFRTAVDLDNRFYFPVDKVKATGTWDKQFEHIRKANVMLEKIPNMDVLPEVKEHWMGVGRMYRALAYSIFVAEYGDVPYLDVALDPNKADDYKMLYKPRDPRTFVLDKIREDFEYAIAHLRADDGTGQANKYLAGALMSRWMLYHATWLIYHGDGTDKAKVKELLEASAKGADVLMVSGKFSTGNTYNELFSSESLKNNPEIVFYREYVETLFPNALMSYNAGEPQIQGGIGQDVIDSYLCSDGLPIGQSPLYQGGVDPRIESIFQYRDPRLYQTIVDSIRVTNGGIHSTNSITGYVTKKFLNEKWLEEGKHYVRGRNSPADAPEVRYAEVLLNYAEAKFELSKVGGDAFSQGDLDKTINKLRQRQLTKWGETTPRSMPTVTLSGNSLAASGVTINDPDRDLTVDPILWEIRRERRVELIMEGFRSMDLNRWAKYEYLNTQNNGKPSKQLLGSWIRKQDHFVWEKDKNGTMVKKYIAIGGKGVNLYNPTGDPLEEGYIYPMETATPRVFKKADANSERNYLKAVPLDQINLYKQKGYELTQNKGWE